VRGAPTHLLNVEALELRTTALLGGRLRDDAELRASCTLHAG